MQSIIGTAKVPDHWRSKQTRASAAGRVRHCNKAGSLAGLTRVSRRSWKGSREEEGGGGVWVWGGFERERERGREGGGG